MKAIFKKISTSILVVLLSVSLTFTNTAAVTYQAAAIPVVYSSWQVLVTILALLGITICAAPELEDDAAQELMDAYVRFKVLKGEGQGDSDGDGEDDLFATFDPLDYLTSNNQLQMSQEDLEAWQQFYYEHMAPEVEYVPVDDSLNFYNCSLQYVLDWWSSYTGYSSSNSEVIDFCEALHDSISSDGTYSFILTKDVFNSGDVEYAAYKLVEGKKYGYAEMTDSGNISFYNNNEKYFDFCARFRIKADGSLVGAGSSSFYGNYFYYGDEPLMLVVYGDLYDLNSICSAPVNLTSAIDWGSYFYLSDFRKSVNNLGSSLTDVVNTVSGLDLSNLLADQSFDVIGSGREYNEDTGQAEGDIVVPMPSPGSIADYQTGDLSYEDLLEEMEVTPIDESTGTDLLTGEFLTIQTGIFSGVNSIVGILQNIWAWLNNLIDSIVQAFIDMLMSLFVPSDGFIDGKIGLITAKLDSLGVAPYDMSGIFDSDDGNPFQNIVVDVNGQEVVIVSFDYLPPFLNKFRPVIRGLLVLFLIYYSINQLLSLIRLSGMMEGGNSNQLTVQGIQGSNVPKIEDKGGKL